MDAVSHKTKVVVNSAEFFLFYLKVLLRLLVASREVEF